MRCPCLQINNAGMGRNNAALFDGKTSSWVEMISTNVLGACMCTREALLVRRLPDFIPQHSTRRSSCRVCASLSAVALTAW